MFSVSDHLTFHLRILNLSGIKLAEINHDICIILVCGIVFYAQRLSIETQYNCTVQPTQADLSMSAQNFRFQYFYRHSNHVL